MAKTTSRGKTAAYAEQRPKKPKKSKMQGLVVPAMKKMRKGHKKGKM